MFLEVRHLRTLVTIRECGNLALASQQLHQTQSALSHQIKSIESYYGSPLFIRKSKPLRFTPLGQQLLNLADHALPLFNHTERQLRQLSNTTQGRLHVAMECHSCFEWLMPTMDVYRDDWPEVEMDISVGFAFEPIPALTKGLVDLVVTSDPLPLSDVHFEPLFRYESLLAIDKTNPLADKKIILPCDLSDQTLITYPVETSRLDIYKYFLNPNDVTPAGRRTAELTAMILQLVASGRGVSALPNWALTEYLDKKYVVARQIGNERQWGTLFAAVRNDDKSMAFMQDFLKMAKKTAFKILKDIEPLTLTVKK